jgi:hypothetical protein
LNPNRGPINDSRSERSGGLEPTVGANDTGRTRPLNEAEQRELAERVHELRALSGEA